MKTLTLLSRKFTHAGGTIWKNRCFFLILTLFTSITLCACRSRDLKGDEKDTEDAKIELVFWSDATENNTYHNAFAEAIREFEGAHPNVKILHETFETEEYKEKIKDAALSDDLPDVFFSWGGEFSKPFIEMDRVLKLDEFFNDKYKGDLPEIALTNARYDGSLFGVTYTTPVSMLFYNKRMFDEKKLHPPETWEEWLKVCDTFIGEGVRPFGVSVKDTWVLAMYLDALTIKYAGPEKTYLALTKRGVSYNDPDFLKPIQKLREWMEMGAFIGNATELANEEVSAMFYNGSVPMYITGSWMAPLIAANAKNPEDFSVVPIPVLNSDNASITDFVGGALDMLMVASNSRHPGIAGEAVFEIARGISKHAYLDGVGIAAWRIDYDDAKVHPITKQIADYTASASSFTLWFDTLMEMEDAGKYLYLLEKLYHGEITPKRFMKDMAKQLEK